MSKKFTKQKKSTTDAAVTPEQKLLARQRFLAARTLLRRRRRKSQRSWSALPRERSPSFVPQRNRRGFVVIAPPEAGYSCRSERRNFGAESARRMDESEQNRGHDSQESWDALLSSAGPRDHSCSCIRIKTS